MNKVVAQTVILSVLTVCLCHQSHAQWSKKPFDATYEMQTNIGNQTLRMLNDGQGHVRNEMTTPSGKMVSLIDTPKKVMYSIMEAQKMVMRIPYNPDPATAITDETSAKAAKAVALGTKTIDGHPCHGWKTEVKGATTETWTGDDINCVVLSSTKGPSYSSTMKLKKYSAEAPVASLFSPPTSGYKMMEMPGAK
jgi:hypothetical protein